MDFASRLRPHKNADGAQILVSERSGSNVDVSRLSTHLFGTDYLERQARVLHIISQEKVFSKTKQANLSRPDRYKVGLARGKRMRQLKDKHNWNDQELLMAEYLVDDIQPYHLHMSLFTAAMREQCSDKQQAYWLPKIATWEIIGAYAQTELGHGSNVRGIECTATWDPQSKKFIIHSPTITASKWWNGTLGRTATHAVVVAQLIVPSVSGGEPTRCGTRPFIVQVRDMKTHQPPDSIIVGDIGPKYGYAAMDNAYMLFNKHRVPHSALLCRYATLDPNSGIFSKPKNPASMYGQLTRVRLQVPLFPYIDRSLICTREEPSSL
jgi:acyl-CoA oxidase